MRCRRAGFLCLGFGVFGGLVGLGGKKALLAFNLLPGVAFKLLAQPFNGLLHPFGAKVELPLFYILGFFQAPKPHPAPSYQLVVLTLYLVIKLPCIAGYRVLVFVPLHGIIGIVKLNHTQFLLPFVWIAQPNFALPGFSASSLLLL